MNIVALIDVSMMLEYNVVLNGGKRTHLELPPPQIVQAFLDFNTCTLKEPDWGELAREQTWRIREDYVLWYTKVSHPQIFPPLPRDLLRPANNKQIIAAQWERYEARSSPDA